MAEEVTWREWSLDGLEVTQLRFDYQFHLSILDRDRELLLIFGVPFRLRVPTGEERTLDPEQNETLGPLLPLLHQSVERFSAASDGRCVLRFQDGTELHGEPHDYYEAWEAHGKGSLADASLLCGPGGSSPWGES